MKSALKMKTRRNSKRAKQLEFGFVSKNKKSLKTFGGETLMGKRKAARPLSDTKNQFI